MARRPQLPPTLPWCRALVECGGGSAHGRPVRSQDRLCRDTFCLGMRGVRQAGVALAAAALLGCGEEFADPGTQQPAACGGGEFHDTFDNPPLSALWRTWSGELGPNVGVANGHA